MTTSMRSPSLTTFPIPVRSRRNEYLGNQSSIAPRVKAMGGRQGSARPRRPSERVRAMTVIVAAGVDAGAVDDATNHLPARRRPSLARCVKSSGHLRGTSQYFYRASRFPSIRTVGLNLSSTSVKRILARLSPDALIRSAKTHTPSFQKNFLKTSLYSHKQTIVRQISIIF